MAVARSQLPQINLFDIPELMPGARSSATPAARTDFEQRCLKLHTDNIKAPSASHSGSAADATVDELAAMFPSLDPALVQALASDAPTPQHAMETLLALAAAVTEPAVPPSPPKDLGIESTDAFPSLMDADGWQVASQHMFNRSPDEDLGSAWRDRAKAIANKPVPQATITPPVRAAALKRRTGKKDEATVPDIVQPEDDYEFRQRIGKQRVYNRAQFSRKPVVAAVNGDCRLGEPSGQDVASSGDEGETQGAQNDAVDTM